MSRLMYAGLNGTSCGNLARLFYEGSFRLVASNPNRHLHASLKLVIAKECVGSVSNGYVTQRRATSDPITPSLAKNEPLGLASTKSEVDSKCTFFPEHSSSPLDLQVCQYFQQKPYSIYNINNVILKHSTKKIFWLITKTTPV